VDLVFVDHDKSRYLSDLLLLEKLRAAPAPPATAAPPSPPLAAAAASAANAAEVKILCLHGHEQNAEIFRKRLGGLPRKMKGAKFFFLDGPVVLPARQAAGEGEAGDGDGEAPVLRSWWRRAREGLIEPDSLQETLDLVQLTWESEGPFAGILGFSMGGTMACQVVMHLPCPGLKFVICAGAPDHPSIEAARLPASLHSLHIWGTGDVAVDCSRSRAVRDKWLASPRVSEPQTIEHGSGHCIPTQAAFLRQYCDFMDAAIQAPEVTAESSLPTPAPAPAAATEAPFLRPGCVVVADNVLSFGAPLADYLGHVRNAQGPYASSSLREGRVEYSGEAEGALENGQKDDLMVDGVEISVLR